MSVETTSSLKPVTVVVQVPATTSRFCKNRNNVATDCWKNQGIWLEKLIWLLLDMKRVQNTV